MNEVTRKIRSGAGGIYRVCRLDCYKENADRKAYSKVKKAVCSLYGFAESTRHGEDKRMGMVRNLIGAVRPFLQEQPSQSETNYWRNVKYLELKREQKQGCLTSPRLLSAYTDGMVKEMEVRICVKEERKLEKSCKIWKAGTCLYAM